MLVGALSDKAVRAKYPQYNPPSIGDIIDQQNITLQKHPYMGIKLPREISVMKTIPRFPINDIHNYSLSVEEPKIFELEKIADLRKHNLEDAGELDGKSKIKKVLGSLVDAGELEGLLNNIGHSPNMSYGHGLAQMNKVYRGDTDQLQMVEQAHKGYYKNEKERTMNELGREPSLQQSGMVGRHTTNSHVELPSLIERQTRFSTFDNYIPFEE